MNDWDKNYINKKPFAHYFSLFFNFFAKALKYSWFCDPDDKQGFPLETRFTFLSTLLKCEPSWLRSDEVLTCPGQTGRSRENQIFYSIFFPEWNFILSVELMFTFFSSYGISKNMYLYVAGFILICYFFFVFQVSPLQVLKMWRPLKTISFCIRTLIAPNSLLWSTRSTYVDLRLKFSLTNVQHWAVRSSTS